MKGLYNIIQLRTFVYIMAKPDNNKPFPVRLGELKPELQQQANEHDRSLHYWIRKILKAHLSKSKKKSKQTI